MRLRLAEKGILRVFISFCQDFAKSERKSWLKGPEYERKAVAIRTSPMRLWRKEKASDVLKRT